MGSTAPGTDRSTRTGERAGLKLKCQQPMRLVMAGHPQFTSQRRGKAEAAVIGHVTNQQNSSVTGKTRARNGAAHQCRADAAIAMVRMNRERPEQ